MSFFDKTEIANQKYIEEKVYSFVLPEMRRFKYYSVVRVHSGMQRCSSGRTKILLQEFTCTRL